MCYLRNVLPWQAKNPSLDFESTSGFHWDLFSTLSYILHFIWIQELLSQRNVLENCALFLLRGGKSILIVSGNYFSCWQLTGKPDTTCSFLSNYLRNLDHLPPSWMDNNDHWCEPFSLSCCVILYEKPTWTISSVKRSQSLWGSKTIPFWKCAISYFWLKVKFPTENARKEPDCLSILILVEYFFVQAGETSCHKL